MVAHSTDLRASLALGTVKKRIRMCGKPAVPNMSAMPKLIADIGSLMKPPGPMIEKPSAAASAGGLPAAVAMAVFTSTAFANIASGLKPKFHSTMKAMKAMKAMKVAPASSRQALMICTQVVAVMPPNSTYTIISAPTMTTAIQYSRPKRSLMSCPAPTIWAIR